jgi:hypothetical protein
MTCVDNHQQKKNIQQLSSLLILLTSATQKITLTYTELYHHNDFVTALGASIVELYSFSKP